MAAQFHFGFIDDDGPASTTGVLPSQRLRALVGEAGEGREGAGKAIFADRPLAPGQIQPASIDLRLGATAWRVRSSFLPGPRATVERKLDQLGMHRIDLAAGAVLEKGCVYVVALQERLRLAGETVGLANPRSSTGRLDVFTRVIADYATEFDRVPRGYRGRLYAEVSPRTFGAVVRQGSRLAQLRLRRGKPVFGEVTLERLHRRHRLVDTPEGEASIREDSLAVTLDLRGAAPGAPVGYRARRHAGLVDVDRKAALDWRGFWDPIPPPADGRLILDPGEFYLLATREQVKVPPDHAAEMAAYDTLVGEFRAHYAGFFDPGFGWSADGSAGSRAVLEVRSHEVPFLLEHGQIMGRLRYERLLARPDLLYGTALGSHYQGQGLALSRHFHQP